MWPARTDPLSRHVCPLYFHMFISSNRLLLLSYLRLLPPAMWDHWSVLPLALASNTPHVCPSYQTSSGLMVSPGQASDKSSGLQHRKRGASAVLPILFHKRWLLRCFSPSLQHREDGRGRSGKHGKSLNPAGPLLFKSLDQVWNSWTLYNTFLSKFHSSPRANDQERSLLLLCTCWHYHRFTHPLTPSFMLKSHILNFLFFL